MNLSGMLTFEGCQKIDQLMRLIASRWVAKWTVHQLLQDEMALGVFAQLGLLQEESEILHIPVQIARDQDFAGIFELDHPAAPAGGAAESRDRLCQRAQET